MRIIAVSKHNAFLYRVMTILLTNKNPFERTCVTYVAMNVCVNPVSVWNAAYASRVRNLPFPKITIYRILYKSPPLSQPS